MLRTAAALFSAAIAFTAAASAQAPVQSPQNGIPVTVTRIGPDGQRNTTTVVIKPVDACPVSMQATQRGLTQMVRTKRTPSQDQPEAMPAPAQHLHLILKGSPKDKLVASATVTARGISARSHMQNLNLSGGGPSDIRRTLQVTFTPDQDGSVSADIDLPAFTAVNSLQLLSITYADGSSWTPEKSNACTVQPDALMLIAGR
ncbi:MAG TPA: hypothetical protein VNJ12_04425 [Candidatus Dormibacteraeota bacterium]|nr:hypothetical protein [Candidatus Dormibacteraeota bacterium]